MYYQKLFEIPIREISHPDPHLFFEQVMEVANEGSVRMQEDLRVLWDSREQSYIFMQEVRDEQ